MAITKIIANTPQTPNNSDAQDWASVLNAIVGVSGVLTYGNELEVEIVNDNKIKVKDGVYSLQGHMIRNHEGTDLELTVNSGTLGVKRIDLLVVTYEKNINNQEDDVFKFEVIQGDAIASNEGNPTPPSITQNDLLEGGTKRQEVLYELHLNETTLSLIDKRKLIKGIKNLENRIEDGFDATKIESGSNANGSWIKFPDGMMICHYAHGRIRYNWQVDAGGYNNKDVNLPQSFVGNYTIEIHGIPHNDSAIPRQVILVAEMHESDVIRMRALAIQNFDYVRGFGYTAIGRWK